MMVMDTMSLLRNNDEDSNDSRDFLEDIFDDEAFALKRDELLAEFIEEVDADLPPIPKVRIKITKHPIKKKSKSSEKLDEPFQSRQPRRASKTQVSYEILDDIFVDDSSNSLPSPPVTIEMEESQGLKNVPVKVKPPKIQDRVLKKHPRLKRFRKKKARREVSFDPDSLTDICYNSLKVHDPSGTTCHQCRQKTLDLKSRCYSPDCPGVRGQFCGYCLHHRYGEDVAVVLRDPNWKCPPCRGICNCSICRRSRGKPPTGQLYQFALKNGFTSVKEYLAQLGDDVLEPTNSNNTGNEENVLITEHVSVNLPGTPLHSENNNIKQEPVDYENCNFDFVRVKGEPEDYEFEGMEEVEQVDENLETDFAQEDTQQTFTDMIEFEPVVIKQEPPEPIIIIDD